MVFGGFIGSSSNTDYFWLGGSMNWAVVRGTRVCNFQPRHVDFQLPRITTTRVEEFAFGFSGCNDSQLISS